MSLLTRLIDPHPNNEERLPVHQFMAALAEYKRGAITGTQVASAFNLSAGETTALQEFLDNLDTSTIDRAKIHDVLMLGSYGLYTITKVRTELQIT